MGKRIRNVVFLTGSRADFGKLKPLIERLEADECFRVHIFATGMHMLPRYGTTVHEILKTGLGQVHAYNNQVGAPGMDLALASTITGLSSYVRDLKPDLIVVHGDRPEPLAGAIVGSFNNIRVAHIEGGEVSGTLDELVRHSITKLAHAHFVSNSTARKRLLSMGEDAAAVYEMGVPSIDLMRSDSLPGLGEAKQRYGIQFERFGVLAYHPVTTALSGLQHDIEQTLEALDRSGLNYVVVHPNNDSGSDIIRRAYQAYEQHPRFRFFRSIRFEFFLSLFKGCQFIVGNSSAGILEAPAMGVPSLNLGSRQTGRFASPSIFDLPESAAAIAAAIQHVTTCDTRFEPVNHYGDGNSAARFVTALKSDEFWQLPLQKAFRDGQAIDWGLEAAQ